MSNVKGNFIKKTAALAALLIAYCVVTLFRLDNCGNILSPINAFAAAGILCFSYLRSDRTVKVSVTLLLYALACVAWGIADTIWAILSFAGGAPEDSPVLWTLYVLPNCFFLASLIYFAKEQFRKWDLMQFSIDLIISGFMTIVLFWIVFLHQDITMLVTLLASDFTSVLSIITDILVCISVFSWFLSIRSGKIPIFMRIISFGLVLFALVDMLYYYLYISGLYFPNSLNDVLYILSLVIIAFGALWMTYKKSTVYDLAVVTNSGGRMRWVYLLVYPLFAVLFSMAGVGGVRVGFKELLAFAVPIFLYWASCKYIQVSLEKEALLKNHNKVLEQRVAEQVKELTFLANQDTLTTLFNRRYFMNCLDDTLKSMCASDLTALLIIDLDRFKTINDSYGHDVGDKVLIDLSYRMIEWNNYGATIARLGGDEFAFMFTGKYTKKDVEDYCAQIIDFCGQTVNIEDRSLNLTLSIGIALAEANICDGKALMQNADIAMHRAKSQGYNRYLFYDAFMTEDFRKTAEIEVLLQQIDVEKDFELFYQPQYSLPEKKLIGAEALIRWKNPEHGYIPPNVFIPIAEQFDYIFKIGKWVMQEAIKQSISWNNQYSVPLKIGFNISPKQFNDKGFIDLVKALFSGSDIKPAWIDAEITESVMINSNDNLDEVFTVFRELGISVSIDDFGSGYSALGYLNKYPFDRLKIDKSLIDNISPYDLGGTHVVRAAINMAHASGILTIAEGVEKQEQLDILVELGCDQVQGYLLGRPVPADVFEQRYIKN